MHAVWRRRSWRAKVFMPEHSAICVRKFAMIAQKSAPNMMQNTARTALRCAMSAPKSVVAWLHETFYSKGLIKNISRSRALGALPRKAQRSGCRRSLDIS